jgi:hypothetical protein
MVSQFVRDMSAAESALVEAAIHRDAGHRVDADMSAAKATDMRASEAANLSNAKAAAQAADMTAAANTTTATRQGGTAESPRRQHRHNRNSCCDWSDRDRQSDIVR